MSKGSRGLPSDKDDKYRLLAIQSIKERERARRRDGKENTNSKHLELMRKKFSGPTMSEKTAKLVARAIKDMLRS